MHKGRILCQRGTQYRLETSMETQVTDAMFVEAGGVHFSMTLCQWSIDFKKSSLEPKGSEKRDRRSDEHF